MQLCSTMASMDCDGHTSSIAASCVVDAVGQCPCDTAVAPLDVAADAPAAAALTVVALLLLLPTLDSWYNCRADSRSLEFIAFAALCVWATLPICSKHADCDWLWSQHASVRSTYRSSMSSNVKVIDTAKGKAAHAGNCMTCKCSNIII
jgi:hypothetical protein